MAPWHERPRPVKHQQLRLLMAVCGIDPSVTSGTFAVDTGIAAYSDHIGRSTQNFCTDNALEELYVVFLGHDVSHERKSELLVEISAIVAKLLTQLDTHMSIDDITQKVLNHYNISADAARAHMQTAYQVIFACIGWTSMLFTPVLHPTLSELSFSRQHTTSAAHRQIGTASKRPLGALLRGFGVMPLHCLPSQGVRTGEATLLAVSCLNYFSLRALGGLKISWADDIASHCILDASKKQLTLFRFPSLCSHIHCSSSDLAIIGW